MATAIQISKTVETHAGTITSWLPMTTTPPIDPRCDNHVYNPDSDHHTLIAFDPRLEADANMTCLPSEAAEWYTQKKLPFGAMTGTVTSLGPMICPNAYTTASTSKKDESSTMIYCCPSNYDFATPADHGMLYGCTSQQTQAVTVHFPASNPAASTISTLVPGLPSRAPNVAGIAVNGWIFKPSPPSAILASPLPTSTFTADVWSKRHLGVSTAIFCGIILGGIAVISLFMITLCWCFRRRYFRPRPGPQRDNDAKSEADDQVAIRGAAANDNSNSMRSPSTSDESHDVDVEMQDLDPTTGSRVPSSAAQTVLRHSHESSRSVSKNEGSVNEADRTA